MDILHYQKDFIDYLESKKWINEPKNLYEPIDYIIKLGGKRMRPILLLLAHQLYNKDFSQALLPSVAIEVFHNFTLLHDDIMDKAPLRRGKATVHKKWNVSTALLSGDVMLVKVYDRMLLTLMRLIKLTLKVIGK